MLQSTLIDSLARARFILIAFFVFSLPLLIYPSNTSYTYTKAIYALFMISFLLALWVGEMELRKRYALQLPPLLLPLAGVMIAAALSMRGSQNLAVSLSSFTLLLYFAAFYLVLVNTVRTSKQVKVLLGSLLTAGGLVSLYALLQYGQVLPGPPETRGQEAMISTLGNVNYVAGFLSFSIVPGLALLLGVGKHSVMTRSLIFVGLGLALVTLLFAGSEGSWLALAISLVFFGLLAFLSAKRRRIWDRPGMFRGLGLAAFLAIGIGLLVVFASPSLVTRLGQLEGARSVQLRLWNWRLGWEMFRDHPWSGVGLGHYKLKFLSYKADLLRTEWGKHFDFYIPRSAQTHNEYIQVAAEMGAFGLAALAWVLGSLLWGLRRMLRVGRDSDDHDQSQRLLQLGLYAGVVAFLVDSGFDFPLHRPASALALVIFVGLLHSRPLSPGRGVARSTSMTIPTLKLGRRGIAALAVSILLVAVTVSLLAYRDFRADLFLEAGRLDLQAGRLLAAKAKLERSVQWAFQPAAALFHLGEVYGELGNHQQAVEALERSLQGRVTEGAYLLLAQAYLQAGMDERAWESVQRLLATEPHPIQKASARYLRAELFRRKGDLNLALLQLSVLIRDQPDFVEAYLRMAEIHQQQREFKAARELYLRGLRVASNLLERKERLLREGLTGPGLAAVEWKRLLRQIAQLERQIEKIREALRGLALPIRTSKGRI